jgi:hypothetical protein
MQSDTDGTGIDFFDFLSEAWRVKWVIAAIIIVAMAIGILAAMGTVRDERGPAARQTLVVPFYLDAASDPLQRKPDELLLDVVTRVFADKLTDVIQVGSNELAYSNQERYRDKILSYFRFSSVRHGDVIISFTKKFQIDPEIYGKKFTDAAFAQVAETRKLMDRNIDVASDIVKNIGERSDEYLSRQSFIAEAFIRTMNENPDKMRFVVFSQPSADSVTQFSSTPESYRRYIKSFIIWGLVGGVIAVFFVMFRIGIRRKKARSAPNPA